VKLCCIGVGWGLRAVRGRAVDARLSRCAGQCDMQDEKRGGSAHAAFCRAVAGSYSQTAGVCWGSTLERLGWQ
jgi:hypothetical protein